MPIGKQIFDISSICEYLLVEICLDPLQKRHASQASHVNIIILRIETTTLQYLQYK